MAISEDPSRQASPHESGKNLYPTPLPTASVRDWQHPEETIEILYRRAEQQAIDAVTWYLKDKTAKKRASQILRAFTIVLAAAGGLVPLITIASGHDQWSSWGYVLLAAAAACVGFDRFFGLSSAWMRDIGGAQAIQSRLDAFQYSWAAICASTAPGDLTVRLSLLTDFVAEIDAMVNDETSAWTSEFQTRISHLEATTSTGHKSIGKQH